MPVKLPRSPSPHGVVSPRSSVRPAAADPAFRISTCTTNLGATAEREGDPRLPHCLVEITDASGEVLRRLSLGRQGLGPELHADVPSRRCDPASVSVSASELQRFEQALRQCADEGYAWGERDCCSCVERAFGQGLARPAPPSIADAAARLAAVPDPFAGKGV